MRTLVFSSFSSQPAFLTFCSDWLVKNKFCTFEKVVLKPVVAILRWDRYTLMNLHLTQEGMSNLIGLLDPMFSEIGTPVIKMTGLSCCSLYHT